MGIRCGGAIYRLAGLGREQVAYLKAVRCDFASVDTVAERLTATGQATFASSAFADAGFSYLYYGLQPSADDVLLSVAAKRHHWLAAPTEVDETALRACLPPPELGTRGWRDEQGNIFYDISANNVGCSDGTAAAEVFERLGELENALTAADTDLRCNPHNPYAQMEVGLARARCLAKLGRTAEAEGAFEQLIADAITFRFSFWELLARRDFIVHVLDDAERRDEQMAPLGKCITMMVQPASEFTEVLGHGIDTGAAVAAFEAAQI